MKYDTDQTDNNGGPCRNGFDSEFSGVQHSLVISIRELCTVNTDPKTPFDSLPSTVPEEKDMLVGEIGGDSTEIEWSVPEKMYSLAEIRAWPIARGIQGFELTYKVPDDFTGYTAVTKMFGSSLDTTGYQAVLIDVEVSGDIILRGDDKVLR